MDDMLRTNTRAYLIDIMKNKGYNIQFNNIIIGNKLDKKIVNKECIKERIVKLLHLDKDNLTNFEKELVTNDKKLEKHFNLRIFLNDNIEDKIIESIKNNLFIETIKNKLTKLKICKEIFKVLEINGLESLNKDIVAKFPQKIENKWLKENIETIKKVFEIRTKKYNTFTYYNIYLLMITIVKGLFADDIIESKKVRLSKDIFYMYSINTSNLENHLNIINTMNKFVDFLD